MHRSGIRTSDRIALFSGDARRGPQDTTGNEINTVDSVVKRTDSTHVE